MHANGHSYGLFDRWRPTAVIGGAWSQSPASADCAARSRARDTASVTIEVSHVSAAMMIPKSQFRCLVASCPVGAKVADDAVLTSFKACLKWRIWWSHWSWSVLEIRGTCSWSQTGWWCQHGSAPDWETISNRKWGLDPLINGQVNT